MMAKLWLCYCCGRRTTDVRPHDAYGVCFRCGMADARYKVTRSCRNCLKSAPPSFDENAVVQHNRAVERGLLARRAGER